MPLTRLLKRINKSQIKLVQLRDKGLKKTAILRDALLIKRLFSNPKTIFIINDHPVIAKIADADGVHLGQGDGSIRTARRILGKTKIIGLSCSNLKQALKAQRQGADYIGFGPIFSTPTKPQRRSVGVKLLKEIKKRIKIPFFAIGDINPDNIDLVRQSGAIRVASCRAILNSTNMPYTVRLLNNRLR